MNKIKLIMHRTPQPYIQIQQMIAILHRHNILRDNWTHLQHLGNEIGEIPTKSLIMRIMTKYVKLIISSNTTPNDLKIDAECSLGIDEEEHIQFTSPSAQTIELSINMSIFMKWPIFKIIQLHQFSIKSRMPLNSRSGRAFPTIPY